MYFNLGLGGCRGGGGVIALPSSMKQKLTLESSGQAWDTVSDSLTVLTAPTIEAGLVRQADAFFTAGTESVYSDAPGTSVVDKTFANLLVHYYNTNGSNGLWMKRISATVWKAFQYALDTEFTLVQYAKNLLFFGAGGGAMRDGAGDLIVDINGHVVFARYEEEYEVGGVPIEGIIVPPEVIYTP